MTFAPAFMSFIHDEDSGAIVAILNVWASAAAGIAKRAASAQPSENRYSLDPVMGDS
jgi:hypothetical protein